MSQLYFDRLSRPKSGTTEVTAKTNFHSYNRLSYKEIACLASYMDSYDITNFRRLSKVSNYAACMAINDNLESF